MKCASNRQVDRMPTRILSYHNYVQNYQRLALLYESISTDHFTSEEGMIGARWHSFGDVAPHLLLYIECYYKKEVIKTDNKLIEKEKNYQIFVSLKMIIYLRFPCPPLAIKDKT